MKCVQTVYFMGYNLYISDLEITSACLPSGISVRYKNRKVIASFRTGIAIKIFTIYFRLGDYLHLVETNMRPKL